MNRITIAIHPNNKEATVCNLHTGFFGIGRDGYSFPDDETVYPESRVRVVNYIEETFQEEPTISGGILYYNTKKCFNSRPLKASVFAILAGPFLITLNLKCFNC